MPIKMAAHVVVELPISDSKTVFSGTSDEDMAYLKIFWQSIHLNPTIESRLVSSDVRQRIRSHPIKSHGSRSSWSVEENEKQSFNHREPDPLKLIQYHQNVFRLESEDQRKKRVAYLDRRENSLKRLKELKQSRERTQQSAKQASIKVEPFRILPPIVPDYNDDIDPVKEAEMEAKEALSDIEKFERQISVKDEQKQPVSENSIKLD